MIYSSAEFKCLRESLGLTTKWLSRHWGVSEYSVQRWERNKDLPDNLAHDMQGLEKKYWALVKRLAEGDAFVIIVPRKNMPGDRMPSAFYRSAAWQAKLRSGKDIDYEDEDTEDD